MELKYKRVVEVEQNLHHVTDNDSSTSYEILKYWRTIAIWIMQHWEESPDVILNPNCLVVPDSQYIF